MFTIWLKSRVILFLPFLFKKMCPHFLLACNVAVEKSNLSLIDRGFVFLSGGIWNSLFAFGILKCHYVSIWGFTWSNLNPVCHSVRLLLWDLSFLSFQYMYFYYFFKYIFSTSGSPIVHLLSLLFSPFLSISFFFPLFLLIISPFFLLPSRTVFRTDQLYVMLLFPLE